MYNRPNKTRSFVDPLFLSILTPSSLSMHKFRGPLLVVVRNWGPKKKPIFFSSSMYNIAIYFIVFSLFYINDDIIYIKIS